MESTGRDPSFRTSAPQAFTRFTKEPVMKRATPALLALCGLGAAVVLSASSAFATTLLTEAFSYANGGLVASSGTWTTHSGAGTDIQVVSGHAAGDMTQAP